MYDNRPAGTLQRDHWLVRSFSAWPIATTAATAVLAVLLGLGGWWLTTAMSGTSGSGQIHRDVSSAKNREYANTTILGEYQQVMADQQNIGILTVKNPTGKDQIDAQGAQLNCNQDVALYNQSAASILIAPNMPEGYPTEIDKDVCKPGAASLQPIDN